MAKRYLLDFEKPLVELEKQIEQIKELARDSEVDVSQQLLQLYLLPQLNGHLGEVFAQGPF